MFMIQELIYLKFMETHYRLLFAKIIIYTRGMLQMTLSLYIGMSTTTVASVFVRAQSIIGMVCVHETTKMQTYT